MTIHMFGGYYNLKTGVNWFMFLRKINHDGNPLEWPDFAKSLPYKCITYLHRQFWTIILAYSTKDL